MSKINRILEELGISVEGIEKDILVDTIKNAQLNTRNDYEEQKKLVPMMQSLCAIIEEDSLYSRSQINALKVQLKKAYTFKKGSDALKILREMKANVDNKVHRKQKYKLPSFPMLQRTTWGLDDGLYLVAADSNIGKTLLLIGLIVDVLVGNTDSRVCFVTADDTARKILRRIVACMTVKMSNGISNATRINNAEWVDDTYNIERDKIRNNAYEILDHLLKTERLKIFTGKVTISELEDIAEENPKSLLLVDSSYKLNTGKTKLEKDIGQSEALKDIAVENELTVVAVKDARKGTDRGAGVNQSGEKKSMPLSVNDIKGDGSWIYEPDFIGMIWLEGQDGILSIQKNKIDSETGIARLEIFKAYNGCKEINS